MGNVIIKKFYSAKDKLFHVIKDNGLKTIDKTYDTFDRFYMGVKKDLSNCDLLDYPFKKKTCNLMMYPKQ